MAQAELDAIDRRILAILQENGRLSNQEIAERVNLSPAVPAADPAARGDRRDHRLCRAAGSAEARLDLLAYVSVRLEARRPPVRVDETSRGQARPMRSCFARPCRTRKWSRATR